MLTERSIEHQDALALEVDAGEVLAIAGAAKRAHLLSGRRRAGLRRPAAASCPPPADLQVRLQAVDVLALRHAGRANAQRLGARGADFIQQRASCAPPRCVVSTSVFSSVLRSTTRLRAPIEHLFLDAVDLRLQRVGALDPLGARLSGNDRVEQHHGTEAAADAVQEREAEDFDFAATHGSLYVAPVDSRAIRGNSMPGFPVAARCRRQEARVRGP